MSIMSSLLERLRAGYKPLASQLFYATLLVIPALITAWLANPLLPYVTNKGEYAFALVSSAAGLAIGVYLLHLLGRVGLFIAPLFAVILTVFTYITTNYNLEPGPSLLGAFMETTFEEASVFFAFEPVLLVSGCVIAYVSFIWWTRRFFSYINVPLLLLFVAHALFVQSSAFTRLNTRDMRQSARWSMDYISDPLKYSIQFPVREKEKLKALRELPSAADMNSRRETDEPLIVVLIVGEALRSDHLGINGYHRNTTPGLAAENLVNFSTARSFATLTRDSVIAMLTDIKPGTTKSAHGSFVPLFKKTGFHVATYSATTKATRGNFSFNVLTEGAKRFFSARPDLRLVDMLKTQIATNPHELHILSPYGNHAAYKDAYPPEEAVFTPDAYTLDLADVPSFINSYDNAVVYTDKVLVSIIDFLRPHNAILLYASDHGESLGEGGRFYHGNKDAPEQYCIPFFFWFSDSYRERHGERIRNLELRTHETATHHHIFHTLVGLADIRCNAYDARLDLSASANACPASAPSGQ